MIYLDLVEDVYVNFALRALAGFGKGKYVMAELEKENPTLYEQVMQKAKRIFKERGYDRIVESSNEEERKKLAEELVKEGVMLQKRAAEGR